MTKKATMRLPRTSSRLLAATALLLTLAACGTTPVSTPPASALVLRQDAPPRAALLAAAETEWMFFDRQQIDMRGDVLSAPRLGLLEDEGEAVQRIGLYWQAVGKSYTGADTQQAWSAAFISYLMQTAGVSPDDFLFSDVHFNYLSFLKARQSQPAPLFVLHPAATEPIAPGDLICARRDSNSTATLEDIRPGLPGHCDLVYEIHPERGWAGVIGGNVFNSVSESLIPIDANARLLPLARRPWFVVVKNLMP
ncbi:DUF2272 domain-containing protein [Herbaspirillum sp. meg3]|uniref:DUF2272 domain-containing protein n=1 Tax=Herbaspirillum sp. meg3 TaxID=2025949 RepID=UPI001E291630|nr:DUF2272 domain-containing protein [Herbaspirillum sp. meg3]